MKAGRMKAESRRGLFGAPAFTSFFCFPFCFIPSRQAQGRLFILHHSSLDSPMLLRQTLNYRRRAGVAKPRKALQTLVLVSANYDETVPVLSLIFDRAIDASAFVAAQVVVIDGSTNNAVYRGVGPATVEGPTRIDVALEFVEAAALAPVTLTASAFTGLTAVDDGGTWAGVTDVGLPFDA
jgi:hypothetical protein